MTAVPKRTDFETAYAGPAPWDIGRPQQAFLGVADADALLAKTGGGEGIVAAAPEGGIVDQQAVDAAAIDDHGGVLDGADEDAVVKDVMTPAGGGDGSA